MTPVSEASFNGLASIDAKSGSISLATVAVVAAALLVYVSGAFILTEIAGVKRYVQGVLIVPIGIAAVYYFVHRPQRLLDPLICFVVVVTATEVALRRNWLYTSDDLATLLALAVIYSAPARSVEVGVRVLVWLVGIFASMAMIQWVALFIFPELAHYQLLVSDEGRLENTVQHPIALLGLTTGEEYSFLGQPVSRLQSFSREPSLNIVYFLIPACLALLMRTGVSLLLGTVMLLFCVLSFSGSVFLSLAFAAVWWLLLHVFTIRFALAYGTFLLLAAYSYIIRRAGSETILLGITFLTQYGDFFQKTRSFSVRTAGTLANMADVWSLPFGRATLTDIPEPWPVSAVLAGGWLGAILLFLFIRRMASELDTLNQNFGKGLIRLSSILLLGTMTTVIVFNDYQMSNYSGLILMAFVYRLIQLKNDAATRQNSSMRRAE